MNLLSFVNRCDRGQRDRTGVFIDSYRDISQPDFLRTNVIDGPFFGIGRENAAVSLNGTGKIRSDL